MFLARASFVIMATATVIMLASPVASAATLPTVPSGGQALQLAPPIITLTANPGQTIKTQMEIRDIASGPLVVSNQINDFVADGTGGTPKILTGNDSNNPFSMKSWITPLPDFELAKQQIKTLDVTIHVPANASPGGHYGVIRFSGIPPQLQNTGVSLSASIGSLVLLTVNGHIVHKLSVQNFQVTKNNKPGTLFQSTPLTFNVYLKNSGNIQEQPTGHIIITDMFGKAVAGVNINIPPRNVLPASTRLFQGPLNSSVIGNKRFFGHYTATLYVQYGLNNRQALKDTISFWVIPYKTIIGVVVVIIVLFFVLRFLLKRYNRRIIAKAGGQVTAGQSPPPSKRKSRKK